MNLFVTSYNKNLRRSNTFTSITLVYSKKMRLVASFFSQIRAFLLITCPYQLNVLSGKEPLTT